MEITVETNVEEKYVLIAVSGEIDLGNVGELKKEVISKIEDVTPCNLVVDLKEVDYIDSTGLGVLIGLRRRVKECDGELYLIVHTPRMEKLFKVTGLVNVFKICQNVGEALVEIEKGR